MEFSDVSCLAKTLKTRKRQQAKGKGRGGSSSIPNCRQVRWNNDPQLRNGPINNWLKKQVHV